MPFTPLHFGPLALVGLPALRRVDLPVLLLSNLVIDLEPYAVLALGLQRPEHGALHSYTVGSLAALAWAAAAWPLRGFFRRAMEFFCLEYSADFARMVYSSLLGVWSHVLLDSMLYPEIRPFYPLGGNAMFGVLSERAVYGLCAAAFLPAAWFYLQKRKKEKR